MPRARPAAAVAAPAAPAPTLSAATIRDRVVELRRVKAADLRANSKNWRLHSEGQRSALTAMLKDVGFVGAVIARQVEDGGLELLDGHLRADTAPDFEVPVLIVDLNDDEAKKVLATYDPLGSMAITDERALGTLLGEVSLDDNAELRRLLTDMTAQLAAEEEKEGELPEVPGMSLQPHEHYDYLVVLATSAQDWNVLCDRLGLVPARRRGRMGTCRAVRAEKLLELMHKPESK